MVARPLLALALALAGAVLAPASGALPEDASRPTAYVPPIRHVFVIDIESTGFDDTWGDDSTRPYLAATLRGKGVLLNKYYATAHDAQPNYVAQISGQGPNPAMQANCTTFSDFVETSTQEPDQAVGAGCVFPADVPTLPRQLTARGITWKAYLAGMPKACQHPEVGAVDSTQSGDYQVHRNPFVYFHSIIDDPAYCQRHVVGLGGLPGDLKRISRTPRLSFVTPPAGAGDTWLKRWVPAILRSPAFRKDGLLVLTSDQAELTDADGCCGPETSANTPLPGLTGAGGGKVGALLISRFIERGTWSTTPYNHYSLLGSLEEIFGVPKLGYARDEHVDTFGLDVYNHYR